MSITLSIVIFAEIIATILVVYGFLHEDKVIQFEDRMKEKIKRFFRNKKRELASKWLAKDGIIVPKTDWGKTK